jgi:5-hydroxyisourate hydrolase-like protein (transthyretin family)
VIYGEDPAPGKEILVTIHLQKPTGEKILLVKDLETGNGEFTCPLPITEDFPIGKYTFTLQFTKGNYESETNEEQSPFYVARKAEFMVPAEGQTFPVYVESIEYEVSNVSFDRETKSLTFDVRRIDGKYAHDDFLQFPDQIGIMIKRPLIDAPFSILVEGEEGYLDPYAVEITGEFSGLAVYIGKEDDSKVSIVGTYAIPEFGLTMMLAAVAFSMFLLARFKSVLKI